MYMYIHIYYIYMCTCLFIEGQRYRDVCNYAYSDIQKIRKSYIQIVISSVLLVLYIYM